jgi:hypothetical protein
MMTKKTLPNIGADLDGPPRLMLPPGGEMPDLSDAAVEAGTALLKQKHKTLEPSPTAKSAAVEVGEGAGKTRRQATSVKTANLYVIVPADLIKQISRAALEKDATKSYIVCQALANAGFDVHADFLVPDRRGSGNQ